MPGGDRAAMVNGRDDVLLKYIDDKIDSYANILDNAKTNITDSDKVRLIAALKNLSSGENLTDTVDVERVIRYFVVHNFVLNFDSYTGSMIHNFYLYEKDGQMQMIPWDYNLAFGGFRSAGGTTNLINYPIDSPISGGNTEDWPMIAWIFANEEYTQIYHQYFAEFISKYFDNGYFEEMIDRVSSILAPFVEKDPTKFCIYEAFETGVSALKTFCLLRAESVTGQLSGTIGPTSDIQKSETLINAGDLQITDMGSMNHAMGAGRGMQDDQIINDPPSFQSGDMPQMPESDIQAGAFPGHMHNGMRGAFPAMNGQMPNPDDTLDFIRQERKPVQAFDSASTWIALAVLFGVLTLGVVFALRFKRRT